MKGKRLLSIFLTLSLISPLLPGHTALAAGNVHVMNEANNWDISGQLIEPGDSFLSIEKEERSVRDNGNNLLDTDIINYIFPELKLDEMRTDTTNLIRSTADTGKITADATTEIALVNDDDTAGTATVTSGYVNNTGLPFTISFLGSGSDDRGKAWVYEPVQMVIKEAFSSYKNAPFITFYEPYYTITYENMTDDEQAGLPDCYYIDNEEHTIVLPKLTAHKPGEHFYGYSGPEWFDERYNMTDTEDSICYSYSWDYFKIDHNYPLRDVTIEANYVEGPTLTFHTDGGTLDGERIEVDTVGNRMAVDLSSYQPVKAGFAFQGWSSNGTLSGWILNPEMYAFDDYDISLYALWLEGEDASSYAKQKSLLEKGYYFDESIGELTIATDEGEENWYLDNQEPYEEARESDYANPYFLGKIKTVVFMEGVTEIQPSFLGGCFNLNSVQIPTTLTTLGENCFAYCSSLTNLEFACENAMDIQPGAFLGCTGLKDITFGTMDTEYPLWVDEPEREKLFYYTNPNLKIHVDPSVEQAIKELLPLSAHRVNTADRAEYYGLVVNGEQISDKKLTVQCGEGVAVYDPQTNTLTLDNATITESEPDGVFYGEYPSAYNPDDIWHPLKGKVGIFNMIPGLNIVLKGTNTITDMGAHTAVRVDDTVEDEAHPIYSLNGSVQISGDGSLCYADSNNENAMAELYFEIFEDFRSGSISIDGVTLKGKYRLTTSTNCATVIKNASLEDTLLNAGGNLTITRSTVNCNKLGEGFEDGLSCYGNITFNYSTITLNDPITGYGTLSINGGYVKVDLTGQSIYRVMGGINSPIYLIQPEDIHLANGTQVKQGSFNRANIADEVLVVQGGTDGGLTDFTDVKVGAYYEEAVAWALSHTPQITQGMGNNQFAPDKTCTRGQVVTFLWRAMGEPEPRTTDSPFSDVKEGAYYYKAVLWANENNITNGTGVDTFSPQAACTRGQVVTFLWRAKGKPLPSEAAGFEDVPDGKYYSDAVAWAVEQGITNGTGNNRFSPDKTCTRGQIVTFLYRDME